MVFHNSVPCSSATRPVHVCQWRSSSGWRSPSGWRSSSCSLLISFPSSISSCLQSVSVRCLMSPIPCDPLFRICCCFIFTHCVFPLHGFLLCVYFVFEINYNCSQHLSPHTFFIPCTVTAPRPQGSSPFLSGNDV